MGTNTFALAYGIPGQKIKGFDPEAILELEYPAAMTDVIQKLQSKPSVSAWEARNKVVPTWNGEGTNFIGFFVAVGASGMDGIPLLKGIALSGLDSDKRYKKSMKAAADAWAKFSDWCDGRGIVLPVPSVWLVECEVA